MARAALQAKEQWYRVNRAANKLQGSQRGTTQTSSYLLGKHTEVRQSPGCRAFLRNSCHPRCTIQARAVGAVGGLGWAAAARAVAARAEVGCTSSMGRG